MLRITVSTSAAGAKRYFTEGLARQDYYLEGEEIAGRWGGLGARLLGLEGAVHQRDFFALAENLHPGSGQTLTVRQKAGRRVGYDFTFSAPKSVSLLYGLTGDERIVGAFRGAVSATMRELEAEMQTRVRKGGAKGSRVTGNLAWAEFVHFTSRPVDGVPDPNLHAHCFAFNATYDRAERRWKAGEFGDLHRDRSYFEAAFHARLAAGMRALGHGTLRRGKWWDLEGVPRALIQKFSRRTAGIDAKADALGITDPDHKAALGATTRERKLGEEDLSTLRAGWRSRLTPGEAAVMDGLVAAARIPKTAERFSAMDAIAYGVSAAFERASVVPEKSIREAALRRSAGLVPPEALPAAAVMAGVITRDIEGQRLATTREVLAEEEAMLAFARQGRGAVAPLYPGTFRPADMALNDGQRSALDQVLAQPDRVILLEGGAGTGKTTLLKAVRDSVAATGRQLLAFAPTAEAARTVLRGEGFDGAETVARFLIDPALRERARGQVILVDEAGLVGVRTLARLFVHAGELGARVILAGDTRQHEAIERGDALRLLIGKAGLPVTSVTKIVRQRSHYRAAVAKLSRGEVDQAFSILDGRGWIIEAHTSERLSLLAEDYVAAWRDGKSVLAVAPTHAEAGEVNALVRARLREEGVLTGEDCPVPRLRELPLTEAQRRDPASYHPGLIVQFARDAPGIRKGERLRVTQVTPDAVTTARPDGQQVALPLGQAARFQLFKQETLPLAAGERIRITRTLGRLAGGSLHTVKGVTPGGEVVLAGGMVLPARFGHLAHGYAATSYASQGKTVDRVFLAQGAQSFPATSARQLYVALSRGREEARLYTDDREGLLKRLRQTRERQLASELVEGKEARPLLPAGALPVKAQAQRAAAYLRVRSAQLAAEARRALNEMARQVAERERMPELAYAFER